MFGRTLHRVGAVALGAAVAACSFSLGSSSAGQAGRVSFTNTSACFWGCDVGRAMMVGTRETISFHATVDSLPPLTAESSAPAVIEVVDGALSCCTSSSSSNGTSESCQTMPFSSVCGPGHFQSGWVHIHVIGPGTVQLNLRAKDGSVYDQHALNAAVPAQVFVGCSGQPRGVVTLKAAQSCMLSMEALDGAGNTLTASEGVHAIIADATVATFAPGSTQLDVSLGLLSSPSITAVGVGTTTISATAGGAMGRTTVTVM
jgi:hypothetical protein